MITGDPVLDNFATRLTQLRLECGLNKHQLSIKAGLDWQRIKMFENGKVLPSLKSLLQLSRALGVSLDELVGVEDQ